MKFTQFKRLRTNLTNPMTQVTNPFILFCERRVLNSWHPSFWIQYYHITFRGQTWYTSWKWNSFPLGSSSSLDQILPRNLTSDMSLRHTYIFNRSKTTYIYRCILVRTIHLQLHHQLAEGALQDEGSLPLVASTISGSWSAKPSRA